MDRFDPTPTHYFCKMLHNKGLLHKYMTQNIDNLEERAGWEREDIVQAHGANFGAYCSKCRKPADQETLRKHIKEEKVLICDQKGCDFPVKPDITFFGEGLPEAFFSAIGIVNQADLLIVIGTALAVSPFNCTVD